MVYLHCFTSRDREAAVSPANETSKHRSLTVAARQSESVRIFIGVWRGKSSGGDDLGGPDFSAQRRDRIELHPVAQQVGVDGAEVGVMDEVARVEVR